MIKKHSLFVIIIIVLAVFTVILNVPTDEPVVEVKEKIIQLDENVVYAKVPAVDKNGEGLMLDLFVKAEPGSGRIFTDIENLIFWTDTQKSIKTAINVASNLTNISTESVDLTYTLKAGDNTSIVGGGSAGAILTIATVAALKEKKLDSDISITGGINENGTLFEVGGIKGKAEIAKKEGIELFLIPENTASEDLLSSVKECGIIGEYEVCEIDYAKTKVIPLADELNLTIVEVSTIEEVMRYYGL